MKVLPQRLAHIARRGTARFVQLTLEFPIIRVCHYVGGVAWRTANAWRAGNGFASPECSQPSQQQRNRQSLSEHGESHHGKSDYHNDIALGQILG
jgi:hypothetical protein